MQKFDIKDWVNQNDDYRAFRQAVHIILTAIAGTHQLQTTMIMKGGVLLALSYNSPRYTKDIDFSTATLRPEFDLDAFRKLLDDSLVDAVESLGYGLDCRIQRCVINPKSDEATAPSIEVSIGYAYKGSDAHKRLQRGKATDIVRIDYSLNEPVEETDIYALEDGAIIQTYSLIELVAEKLRALLQQEVRKRVRRQDIYDLFYVLSDHPLRNDAAIKVRILERLIEKSRIRGLSVDPEAMVNQEIRRRSEEGYHELADEIEGDLPPFDAVYSMVEDFYRSLPWQGFP